MKNGGIRQELQDKWVHEVSREWERNSARTNAEQVQYEWVSRRGTMTMMG